MERKMPNASRYSCLVAVAALLAVFLAPKAAQSQESDEARTLLQNVLGALPKVPLNARLKLTVEGDEARVLQLNAKFVDGARASYLEVLEPESLAGMRFLFLQPLNGENQQYAKPTFSRTSVLVSGEIRQQPFLGSTFSVVDLGEPKIDDFTYSFVGEEEILGRKCKLVEAVPKKPTDALYSKTILALDPKDLLILKRQFFDASGKLLKVWTIEEANQVDGIWTLVKQKMANVQEKTSSRLDTLAVEYNADIEDAVFEPKYLLR
jgi:outer membrane lipoprotein-sorting protein